MVDPAKMLKKRALAALLLFSAFGPAALAANECKSEKFMQPLTSQFSGKDPDVECRENKGAKCGEIPTDKREADDTDSACEMVYRKIGRTIDFYERKVGDYCKLSNAELARCVNLQGAVRDECMGNHARMTAREEAELAQVLRRAQKRLEFLQTISKSASLKYRDYSGKLRRPYVPAGRTRMPHAAAPPAAAVPDPAVVLAGDGVTCTGKSDPMVAVVALTPTQADKPETIPLVSEQVKAVRFSEAFRMVAETSAKAHEATTTKFQEQAKKFDDLARRNKSVDPKQPTPEKKSDITGTEQKQAAAPPGGGQPPAGGGGQPSGGQSGAAPDQGAGGATAGTPGSLNNSVASNSPTNKDTAAKIGKGVADGGVSRTGDGVAGIPDLAKVGNQQSGFSGSGLASSASRTGGGKSGSSGGKAAAARSPGGSGGGDLGSTSAKVCLGADCQQALGNMKSSQFASVGSLGGGGGLGGLDGDTSSLDALFKADETKADLGPGGLDALGSLDAGLDTGLGGLDGGDVKGAGAGEIGKADGRDLFLRVREFHLQALKRGLLVGVPKKL